MILSSFHRLHRLLRGSGVVLSTSAAAALLAGSLQAKPIPSNLGNGLDKLVASHVALQEAKAKGVALRGTVSVNGKTYLDENAAAVATSSLSSTDGRLLVRITLNGTVPIADLRKAAEGRASTLTVSAVDTTYRGVGVMNAYVDVSEVATLASTPGVAAVVLEWKPRHAAAALKTAGPVAAPADATFGPGANQQTNPGAIQGLYPGATVGEVIAKVGTSFDQGVTQHRIDQVSTFFNPSLTAANGAQTLLAQPGKNMQIACISNSFAANTAHPASLDVTNNDLPGSASATQTSPVFVLQDDLSSSGTTAESDDEGRGMCQIVYKMAPYARVGFGTADNGEVGFANNIRGLAGINSTDFPNASTQGFAADVVCDDVGYFDEPFFQDGIISGGIEDAAAAGVSYFSSAANDIGTNGYDSDTRWVANGTGVTAAAGNTALAGTNIDLTGVPAGLYAGGFHNFNPNGLDVAQTVNIAANNTVQTAFQWNDPYDQATQATGVTQILTTSGTYTNAAVTFQVNTTVTAGTKYQFVEAATNASGFDGIVTIYKSDGVTVLAGPQDTGTDEVVRLAAPANDTGFVVKVDHFGSTTGTFSLNVTSFTGFSTPPVTTSLSLLAFNVTTGAYIPTSSLTTDATTTNQPIQLGFTNRPSGTQVQYVIARSVVPAQGNAYPTHIRYLLPGNGRAGYGPAEYFSYNTVTTGGHAMSPNCNGTAAYSVFRPSLPETFTSPGPVNIYYDKNDNRLNPPQIRLQPRIAAADAANISQNEGLAGLGSDSGSDPDATNANFSGTSAAAPHAAAVALLVLQNKGGRRSVTPAQMTNLLQRSTFPHDLDPNFSSGSARVTGGTSGTGKVTITISSDGSAGSATTATGLGDTNSFQVAYVGGSSITSLTFNPNGTLADGNVSGGNNGVTYNQPEATANGTVTYFENSLPGVVFLTGTKAFTLNPTTSTVTLNNGNADSVTGATGVGSNANGANTTQFKTLTVTVPSGSFPSSKTLRFTVGRGLAFASSTGAVYSTVTSATAGAAYYSADIFGGGVSLPSGTINLQGMPFTGTTADGGTFSGTIVNRIGSGWSKTDGYGFINAQTAVSQTVQ